MTWAPMWLSSALSLSCIQSSRGKISVKLKIVFKVQGGRTKIRRSSHKIVHRHTKSSLCHKDSSLFVRFTQIRRFVAQIRRLQRFVAVSQRIVAPIVHMTPDFTPNDPNCMGKSVSTRASNIRGAKFRNLQGNVQISNFSSLLNKIWWIPFFYGVGNDRTSSFTKDYR